MDWFLYDKGLRHERIEVENKTLIVGNLNLDEINRAKR